MLIVWNADNPTQQLQAAIYMTAAGIIGPDKNTTGMLLLISVCFVFRDKNDERGWEINGQSVFVVVVSVKRITFIFIIP